MNTEHIWTDSNRCSGKPCIRGTRFPIAQLLAEIADGDCVANLDQICADRGLETVTAAGALQDLANHPLLQGLIRPEVQWMLFGVPLVHEPQG